jgi:hypothetical protein
MSQAVPLPSDRSFGITFTVVFLLVSIWAVWTGRSTLGVAFAVASMAVLLVAWLTPKWLRPLNRAWMKFGAALHVVVNPIVLGAIYFGVIAPVAIGMRLGGRDALRRRLDPQARSYWIERTPPGPPPDSLPHQF